MPPLFVCIIAHCSSHNSNLILLADDKQKSITPSKSLSPFHIRFYFIDFELWIVHTDTKLCHFMLLIFQH